MDEFFKALERAKGLEQYAPIDGQSYIETKEDLIKSYKHYGHSEDVLKKLESSPFWLVSKDNNLIGLNELDFGALK